MVFTLPALYFIESTGRRSLFVFGALGDLVHHLNNEKKGPWLFRVYVGDEKLPTYIGIIINHDIRILI